MVIFVYDRTFEGLLTAIFDAYSRQIFPDILLSEEDMKPIFYDEIYTVITEPDKSSRVWNALKKKLSRTAINMLSAAWLSEQKGSDELIYRFIRKNIDSKISVETNFGDEDVLQMMKLAKMANREAEYLRQFVRFQKAADNMYFAPVAPKCNSLPLAIAHFRDRFADQSWVIYDTKRQYGFYYDLKTVTEVTLDNRGNHLLSGKLDESLMAEDEKRFQQLWKGYFKALTIKERLNLKLQRQHMPRRFWKYLTEKQ